MGSMGWGNFDPLTIARLSVIHIWRFLENSFDNDISNGKIDIAR